MNVKKHAYFFLMMILFLWMPYRPTEASGEEILMLSLDDAVRRALDNSLSLKKDLIDLSSADYQARRLWAEIFPTISASASAGYSWGLFSGDGFEFNKQGTSYSASLGLSLGLNAGIPYAVKNIQLAYQSRLLSYEDACNQLEIRITKEFYSLIAERENFNLLEEILRLAEQQLERNQIAFNSGLVGELTVIQSRLAMENARYNLSSARASFGNRMGEFSAMLGLELDTTIVLEGEIEITGFETEAEALIRRFLPGRPDIVSRRQEIERLENSEKQIALSGRAPSLTLQTEWNSRDFDPFVDALSGTVRVNIPIDTWVPGTKGAQSVRNAKLAIDKAKLDLSMTEDDAKTQIRSLTANLQNSWENIEIAQLSLRAAERSYELTEEGFRNGTIESLKLEDARNNLSDARQRLLRSQLACQTLILDLSAALNIKWKDLINEFQ